MNQLDIILSNPAIKFRRHDVDGRPALIGTEQDGTERLCIWEGDKSICVAMPLAPNDILIMMDMLRRANALPPEPKGTTATCD